MRLPATSSGPSGCARKVNGRDDPEVAAAAAQAPEELRVFGRARGTCSPSAVITSAPSRLSTVRPCARVSQPTPPPSVRPATPVAGDDADRYDEAVRLGRPVDVGERCARPPRGPSPADGSTPTSLQVAEVDTIPSSTVPLPATLCPPPRTARGSPCARAKASRGDVGDRQQAAPPRAGRRSIMPFQTAGPRRTPLRLATPGGPSDLAQRLEVVGSWVVAGNGSAH